jgi:FkbH-like protein
MILEALSLTPKGAVFVDDNPVERDAVKAALPGIRVIGSNPYLTRRILLWSPEIQVASRTEESKRREQMAQRQIQRDVQRLAISLCIWELIDTAHDTFSRVFELVNKTNQFNTTGKRWTVADYESFWRAGGWVFAFSVTDRFTDYGTVGVVVIKGFEIVQYYVMSCRVLGMHIEVATLHELIRHVWALRSSGAATFSGAVVPSPVNMPCRDLFLKSGFIADEARDGHFVLLPDVVPAAHDRISVKFQPSRPTTVSPH